MSMNVSLSLIAIPRESMRVNMIVNVRMSVSMFVSMSICVSSILKKLVSLENLLF